MRQKQWCETNSSERTPKEHIAHLHYFREQSWCLKEKNLHFHVFEMQEGPHERQNCKKKKTKKRERKKKN